MKCCSQCNIPLVEGNYYKSASDACKECHKERMADKHAASNANTMYVDGKYVSRKNPLFKPGRYRTEGGNGIGSIFLENKYESRDEGYVYIITNKAWPNWVKIGMAEDVEERIKQFQTGSPHRDYVVEHYAFFTNRRKAEQAAHKLARKAAKRSHFEWFLLSVQQAKHILDNLNDKHNGLPKETSKNTKEDKLQERSQQDDLWTYAENKEAERAS